MAPPLESATYKLLIRTICEALEVSGGRDLLTAPTACTNILLQTQGCYTWGTPAGHNAVHMVLALTDVVPMATAANSAGI